jgi:multidrug efflux pump subunit AcrA (membrane-fusion protein)
MKNRWFLLIPLITIVTLISTGCGVSQSEYDAVSVELKVVKQDREALQTQLQETQSQLIDAKTDLVRAQVELETTQGQLDKTQTDLETAQGQLQAAQADRQTAQTQLQESQSELAQTKNDLQDALAQVQSLQNDLDAAGIIPAEALSYAEFMDIVMLELWMLSGVTPNFTISSVGELETALESRAASIGDATLINFVDKMKKGLVVDKNEYVQIGYYCLTKVEAILK